MFALGVITARGGSKRLPNKNTRLLNGRPLFSYALDAAKKSKLLSKTIVSTDSPHIAEMAKEHGAEVPFLRPDFLSNDSASSEDVLRHAVSSLEKSLSRIDLVVLLQPTSPFTTGEMIDQCIEELEKNKWDSVITVVPPSKRCEWIGFEDKGRFEYALDYDKRKELVGKKEIAASGNVYVMRRESLFNNPSIVTKNTGVIYIPHELAVDIDYQADFTFAEFLMNTNYTK